MPKYSWKDNYPKPPIDADVFGGTVEKLEEQLNRPVSPLDVVQEAENPESPIHAAIPWDDKIAAHKHRLQCARELLGGLQLVRVRMADGSREVGRALYNIQRGEHRGYSSIAKVLGEPDLKAQVLLDSKRDLERCLQRYRHIVALSKYLPQLEDLIGQIQADIDALAAEARRENPKRRRSVRQETEVPARG